MRGYHICVQSRGVDRPADLALAAYSAAFGMSSGLLTQRKMKHLEKWTAPATCCLGNEDLTQVARYHFHGSACLHNFTVALGGNAARLPRGKITFPPFQILLLFMSYIELLLFEYFTVTQLHSEMCLEAFSASEFLSIHRATKAEQCFQVSYHRN